MKLATIAAALLLGLTLNASGTLALTKNKGASDFAPGQRQTTPGTAKNLAPGHRQTTPGTAKNFAPGHLAKKK